MERIKIGGTFTSYEDDFEPAFAAFEKENFVNYTKVKSEKNVGNPHLKYKYIQLKCKFYGQHQKVGNARETSTYKQGCPHFVSLHQKIRNEVAVLEITNISNEHNHKTSAELFSHMPKQRIAAIKQNVDYINSSLDARGNYRVIQSRVNANDETKGVITLRDLYNTKVKISETNKHDNDLVQLVEEMLKIEDSVVKVITNNQNELEMIFFQDYRMKKFFEMYPDLIMFDGTYKLNDRRMPLVVLLVVDGNGESQIAGLFIVKSENIETFHTLFEEFKRENSHHDKVNVIVSDKSFANRNIFASEFPQAHHQLCVFHIYQIFEREITTAKRNISKEQRKRILAILHKMVYAQSVALYEQRYQELQNMQCPGVQRYFDENWHPIQEQWVAHFVNRSQNFENRTNNRLENLNQKIKTVVTKYSSLGVFFNDLITLVSSFNAERDHIAALDVMRQSLQRNNTAYDNQYAKYLTRYAFSKYKAQSDKSQDIEFIRLSDIDAECFERNVRINITHQNCSCQFFTSMNLPCSHIIAFLLLSPDQEVFNPNICHNRWQRETSQYMSEFDYVMPSVSTPSQLQVIASTSRNAPPRRLNAPEKYKAAEKEMKKICEIASEKNQREFERLIQSLKEFRKCVEHNTIPSMLYFLLSH